MKSLKLLTLLLVTTSLLASCSNDFDLGTIFSGSVSEVNVSIADADYIETINTRSSHSVDPSRGFVTTWTEGDTIGIYPIGADQVAFPISGGEGSSTASFDGGAWSLRASRQYGAYYPFSKKNYYIDETKIPISYLGQKQTGNNNLDNLSDYDFMAAAAVSPDTNGAVNMTMQHLGAFLRLTITAPEAKTYTKVRLSSDAAIFTTDATINLQDGSLTPTKKADVLPLLLDNVTTTEPNQTIIAYMMLAPISASDISAHPISVTLLDDNGVSYVADLTFTSIVAGKSYAKSASVVLDGFDDSMVQYEVVMPDYLHIRIIGNVIDRSLLDEGCLYLDDNEIQVENDGSFCVVLADGGIHGNTSGVPGEYFDDNKGWGKYIKQGSLCSYQLSVRNNDVVKYGPVIEFTTPIYQPVPVTWSHSVDLGLSVKWCMANCGASGVGDIGNPYQWGDIEPYAPGQSYKYYVDGSYLLIGEQSDTEHNGGLDYNISGNPLYDASTIAHGGGQCRMPTLGEWYELAERCSWYYTTIDGQTGYQVVGPNGNNIFLPYEENGYGTDTGGANIYWSANLWNAWGNQMAYCLELCPENRFTLYPIMGSVLGKFWDSRDIPGFIRPVSDY